MLTIVMYHYVRDARGARFPRIHALSVDEFDSQLDFIDRNYTVVTAEQVVAAKAGDEPLPENPLWLTFDDGYVDHFDLVLPRLRQRAWQGTFFPVARASAGGRVLDVNKLHFVLAAVPDARALVAELHDYVQTHQREGLEPFEAYWSRHAKPSRFNPPDVAFVKTMLQRALPLADRGALTDKLFRRFVTRDEAAFSGDLYLSLAQLKEMADAGMHIGNHGATHAWLNTLSPTEQAAEIEEGLDLMRAIGVPTRDWCMCYPYGAHDDSLEEILRQRHCAVGLTTRIAVAAIGRDASLRLPRIDTNDLPPRTAERHVAY